MNQALHRLQAYLKLVLHGVKFDTALRKAVYAHSHPEKRGSILGCVSSPRESPQVMQLLDWLLVCRQQWR